MPHYVYITTTRKNTALYVGVTNDISRRIAEHSEAKSSSFTNRYNVTKLVYYEEHESIDLAIKREKQLKNWHRDWKLNLIRSVNPEFLDLAEASGSVWRENRSS